MNVGSLFSGIGGFDLGFERAGMRTAWQVEQNPYCLAVLAKHFPDAERFTDVREVGAHNLAPVDLICGGFPCQDLSVAGKGGGITADRSGLWSEFARIIGELRPRYVVVENVPALTRNEWLGRVLGDLASCGYDAEWDCIPASALGAPHRRDRIWLVAYPEGDGRRPGRSRGSAGQGADGEGLAPAGMGDAESSGRDAASTPRPGEDQRRQPPGSPGGSGGDRGRAARWSTEPDVGRVADGVPARVDRLAALGNALVPQIAEWIGRRVLQYERGSLR